MEKRQSSSAKRSAIKISLMALISLLLLIPLAMVESLIEDREDSMETVAIEVANSYAEAQIVYAPELIATSVLKNGENKYYNCKKLDYKVSVDTEVLHRSKKCKYILCNIDRGVFILFLKCAMDVAFRK